MAYLKADYEAPNTGAYAKLAYGKILHVEGHLPTPMCRLDLHWFAKEELAKGNNPLEVRSFPLTPEEIHKLFKENNNECFLETAYKLLRLKDPEYFKDIEDHFNPKPEEEIKEG